MGRASPREVEQLQLKRREHEGSCEEVNDTSAQGYLVRKGARAHLGRFPSRPWITHPPSWAGWMVEGEGKEAAVVPQRLGDSRSRYLQEVNMSRVEAKCTIT